MGIHSKSEEHVHEEVKIKNQNEDKKKVNEIDNSIAGIIKAIQWPSFSKALKYALYTMTASVVIGLFLFIYGYGINQVIGHLFS